MLAGTEQGTTSVRHFDLPTGIISALGVCLGSLGCIYLITHPEPLSIWAFEGLLVIVPAATLAYGGHWIATRSSNRQDRWLAAGLTLGGAIITCAFVIGYIFSELLSGSIVTEIEQLALFGALSGSFVALLAVITIQYHYRKRELAKIDSESDSIFKVRNARRIVRALLRGRVGGIVGLMTELLFNRNLWVAYLHRFRTTTDGFVPFESRGSTLFLDLNDNGISKELLTYGSREEVSTAVLRHETNLLLSFVEGSVTALDIGANRGYYTFQIAEIIGNRGTVFAIEPEPQNVASLRRGIEASGFDNVAIDQSAIGAEDGTEKLMVSNRSNSHTLNSDIPEAKEDNYHSTLEVPVWSIGSFLERHQLEANDINLVKVDVEGYEAEVIDAMGTLFEAGRPDLLFVELHPHRVDTEPLHDILETIETEGFEIVKASSSADDDLPTYESVREHVTSDSGSHTVELIVRQPPSEA